VIVEALKNGLNSTQGHVPLLDLNFNRIQRDLDLTSSDLDKVENRTTNLERDLNIINKDIVETKANLHFTRKEISYVKVQTETTVRKLDEA
jgi:septal ring factor EnvC (AmiA/AmiB activator)